jgi:salicylate hydroxylase
VGGGTPVKTTSPFSAYNIDIPRSLLKADPSLSHLLVEANFWLGPSKIVVGLNMPDMGDKYNICLVSEEQAGKEGEWYELGDLKKVKEKFADFEPDIRKLLDLSKPEDCYIWRFSEMPPLEKWMSDNGKAVITGDAAHAMLPYTGMVGSRLQYFSSRVTDKIREHLSVSRTPPVSPCVSREQNHFPIFTQS